MRKNEEKLGDILQSLMGRRDIQENLDRVAVELIWNREMGPMINRYTQSFRFHRGLLTVEITSAPLRHELSGNREKIRTLLNEEIGRVAVQKIRIY